MDYNAFENQSITCGCNLLKFSIYSKRDEFYALTTDDHRSKNNCLWKIWISIHALNQDFLLHKSIASVISVIYIIYWWWVSIKRFIVLQLERAIFIWDQNFQFLVIYNMIIKMEQQWFIFKCVIFSSKKCYGIIVTIFSNFSFKN